MRIRHDKRKLELPLQPLDWMWEGMAFLGLLTLVIYPFLEYSELPDTIATHFNAAGEPNGYGQKSTLWLISGIAGLTYLGLLILARFPHQFNFPVKITEGNMAFQYRLASRMIRALNGAITIMFAYIIYGMVETAKTGAVSMGYFFLILLMVGLGLIIGLYIYLAKKNQ